jgi:YHS domain-containing protein
LDWSIAKIVLDSLKCPVCQSRIDLLDWKDRSDGMTYNFCCSSNWEHYRIYFVHWELVPRIEYETVIVYEGKHQYRISQFSADRRFPSDRTEINIFELDKENRIISSKDRKIIPPF